MAIEREMAISYGNILVGGPSRFYKLDGVHSLSIGYEESVVEFSFVVVGSDQPEFVSAVQAVETTFRKPHQTLQIRLASAKLLKFSHAESTGFSARPEIIKAGGPKDTGRSRAYRVRIMFGMPASTGAEKSSGLREATIDVAYSPSRRRTVSFSGLYTAVGSSGARAMYDSGASLYCLGELGTLGGTYELSEEAQVEADEQDKECRWTREYDELIFAQGSGATDDEDITRQELRIERRRVAPGDTQSLGSSSGSGGAGQPTSTGLGAAERIVEITARYDAWVNAARTTNLKTKYDSGLKSWITDQAGEIQNGALVLVSESVELIPDDNRISATLVFHALPAGENAALERTVTVEDNQDTGRKIVGVWTGDPMSGYLYQGHTKMLRTITLVLIEAGASDVREAMSRGLTAADSARGQPLMNPGSGDGQWIEMSRNASALPRVRGLDGDVLSTTEIRARIVLEMYKPHGDGGGTTTPRSPGIPAATGSMADYVADRR